MHGGMVFALGALVQRDGCADPGRSWDRPDVIDIVASDTAFCALTRSGGVLCWGDNTHGQLGRGNFDDGAVPTPTGVSIGP